RPPPGSPLRTLRTLRTLCTGGSAPTSKPHPSHPSNPSTGRRSPVSDEWITVEEQVVAEAVAPFVEMVGDAVEAATAVLEALREAGFDVCRPDWCPRRVGRVDRPRADDWTECGTCGGSGKVASSCSDQCDYEVACPDCVDGRG